MNETLEAMAQALFKSWFVDFDPVIDNALAAGNPIPDPLKAKADRRKALGDQRKPLPEDLQNQFPDCFVYNDEMGWVPEGWEPARFGDFAEHIRDGVKADELDGFSTYIGLEHVGKREIFLSKFGTTEQVTSNKSAFQKYDLLFGKLRAYFHKVCIAPGKGVCSTDIIVFRARDEGFRSFTYMTAYSDRFVSYASRRSTGTRMPRANVKDLLEYLVVRPSYAISTAFEAFCGPIWAKGNAAIDASKTLAQIRDTLLPKLLSGELRLTENRCERLGGIDD